VARPESGRAGGGKRRVSGSRTAAARRLTGENRRRIGSNMEQPARLVIAAPA
jgi:hypothetical protein